MEVRDLVNRYRQKTGQTIKKGEQIPEGYYIQVVCICIQNKKGEYLVQKRTKEKNGKYGITSGHVLAGENSVDAILREIKEETSIELTKNDIKLVKSKKEEQDQLFVDIYYAKKEIDIENLNIQKEEVEELKWISEKEIERLYKQGEFLGKHRISMEQCMEYFEDER